MRGRGGRPFVSSHSRPWLFFRVFAFLLAQVRFLSLSSPLVSRRPVHSTTPRPRPLPPPPPQFQWRAMVAVAARLRPPPPSCASPPRRRRERCEGEGIEASVSACALDGLSFLSWVALASAPACKVGTVRCETRSCAVQHHPRTSGRAPVSALPAFVLFCPRAAAQNAALTAFFSLSRPARALLSHPTLHAQDPCHPASDLVNRGPGTSGWQSTK